MSETANLRLPLLAEAQAQKHVTVNAALALLDAATGLVVATSAATSPPSSPVEGACHLVPPGAGGDWAGQAGKLAFRLAGGWEFRTPRPGTAAFLADAGRLAVLHPAAGWVNALAFGPAGGATCPVIIEEEVDLAGAFTAATTPIPDRSVVLAVTTRTLVAVTGASTYDCGIAGEPSKFGGSLGAAAGSTNIGVIGPTAFYAPTPVRLTANGVDFTGGRVRVAVHALTFTGV